LSNFSKGILGLWDPSMTRSFKFLTVTWAWCLQGMPGF
jgi:hypothetical protein